MNNTIKELEKLFLEYLNSNDHNARCAVRECIKIVEKNKGG